jgi:hypothetical protein
MEWTRRAAAGVALSTYLLGKGGEEGEGSRARGGRGEGDTEGGEEGGG